MSSPTWTCSIPGTSTARRRPSWRCACEGAAFATDKRITNSEGAGVSAQQSHFFSAHTRGFRGGYASSRHSISVAPIAGKGDDMQRDAWYSSMRNAEELAAPEAVGRYAAERALARLKSRKIATARMPGAVRVAAGRRPAGRLRAGRERRRALSQEHLPARFAGQEGVPRRTSTCWKTRSCRAARAAPPFDEEGVRTTRAQGGGRGPGGGLLPQQLFGPQAGHEDHRQRRRLAQPDADLAPDAARRRPGRDAAQAGHGPVRHRADGAGRELRDRRLFARRQRLLGREGRDSPIRCRRSPSPAT